MTTEQDVCQQAKLLVSVSILHVVLEPCLPVCLSAICHAASMYHFQVRAGLLLDMLWCC